MNDKNHDTNSSLTPSVSHTTLTLKHEEKVKGMENKLYQAELLVMQERKEREKLLEQLKKLQEKVITSPNTKNQQIQNQNQNQTRDLQQQQQQQQHSSTHPPRPLRPDKQQNAHSNTIDISSSFGFNTEQSSSSNNVAHEQTLYGKDIHRNRKKKKKLI